MGYFSNGTEGDMYEEKYCSRCVHGDNGRGGQPTKESPNGPGCPVMLAHILFAYELCNETAHPGKVMLDMLIPRNGPWNDECAMFVPIAESP